MKPLLSKIRICQLPLLKSTFHSSYEILFILRSPNLSRKFQLELINKSKKTLMSLREHKHIKGPGPLRSANFSDLRIHPGLKVSAKFKIPNFEKYDKKSCLHAHLKFMAHYGDNFKLLVQTFIRSLIGAALSGSPNLKLPRSSDDWLCSSIHWAV